MRAQAEDKRYKYGLIKGMRPARLQAMGRAARQLTVQAKRQFRAL